MKRILIFLIVFSIFSTPALAYVQNISFETWSTGRVVSTVYLDRFHAFVLPDNLTEFNITVDWAPNGTGNTSAKLTIGPYNFTNQSFYNTSLGVFDLTGRTLTNFTVDLSYIDTTSMTNNLNIIKVGGTNNTVVYSVNFTLTYAPPYRPDAELTSEYYKVPVNEITNYTKLMAVNAYNDWQTTKATVTCIYPYQKLYAYTKDQMYVFVLAYLLTENESYRTAFNEQLQWLNILNRTPNGLFPQRFYFNGTNCTPMNDTEISAATARYMSDMVFYYNITEDPVVLSYLQNYGSKYLNLQTASGAFQWGDPAYNDAYPACGGAIKFKCEDVGGTEDYQFLLDMYEMMGNESFYDPLINYTEHYGVDYIFNDTYNSWVQTTYNGSCVDVPGHPCSEFNINVIDFMGHYVSYNDHIISSFPDVKNRMKISLNTSFSIRSRAYGVGTSGWFWGDEIFLGTLPKYYSETEDENYKHYFEWMLVNSLTKLNGTINANPFLITEGYARLSKILPFDITVDNYTVYYLENKTTFSYQGDGLQHYLKYNPYIQPRNKITQITINGNDWYAFSPTKIILPPSNVQNDVNISYNTGTVPHAFANLTFLNTSYLDGNLTFQVNGTGDNQTLTIYDYNFTSFDVYDSNYSTSLPVIKIKDNVNVSALYDYTYVCNSSICIFNLTIPSMSEHTISFVSDMIPPVRSNGFPTGTIRTTSTIMSLDTDESAVCRYSDESDTPFSEMVHETSVGTKHTWNLTGLDADEYHLYIKCNDMSGNYNSNDYEISFFVMFFSSSGGGAYEPPIQQPIIYPGFSYQTIDTFPNFQISFLNCTLKDKSYEIPSQGATVVLQGSLDEQNRPTSGTVAVLLYPTNLTANETKPMYISKIRCIEPEQYAIVHCNQSIIASYEVDVKADLSYLCINYEGTGITPESITINLNQNGEWTPITITDILHDSSKSIICGNITGHTPYMVAGFVPKPEILSATDAIDALEKAIVDNCPEHKSCSRAESLLAQAKAAYEGCDYSKTIPLANQGTALFVKQKLILLWTVLGGIIVIGLIFLYAYFKK